MTSKNPYGLTRANRANLLKLANYLESLPRSYRHFDMSSYVGDADDRDETLIDYMKNNGGLYDKCGTVGCALGHGPSAGVLARVGHEITIEEHGWYGQKEFQVNWIKYSFRFVDGDLDDYQLVWDFLFSGNWGIKDFGYDGYYQTKVDDHHYGAAARIRFILAGRMIPESFDDTDRLELVRAKRLYKEFRK